MSGIEDQFITEAAYVAASQTDQQINTKKGGLIRRLVIVPATTTPGAVSYKDGSAGSARTVFVGGTVVDVKPFTVELNVRGSGTDGFHITTGASVSVIAIGRYNTN